MPIVSAVHLRPMTQEEFARIDYRVMRHAFDSQNELGRLCDEIIYRNDLAARLEAAGLGPVRKESRITISYLDFAKTYRLDLIVGDTAIYELKTEACLAPDHDAQLLNYLFLHGAHHGKLINFRPAQVESKFINTSLKAETRRKFMLDMARWREADQASFTLRSTLQNLLEDWGAFLELRLYEEALIHFLGGEAEVVQMLPLARTGVFLGSQRFNLLTQDSAFRLTAITENPESYERQLHALLRHSPLHTLHWINLAGHRVSLITLER